MPVASVNQVAGNTVFLRHQGVGSGGVEGRVPLAVALDAGDERFRELIREAMAIPRPSPADEFS